MKKNNKQLFEEYKLVHDFLYPNEPLKAWINENTYTNYFIDSWDPLMELVEKIEDHSAVASLCIEEPTIWVWASSAEEIEDIEVDIYKSTKKQAVYKACILFLKEIS